MLILCIADVERDVGMKNLSPKEAIAILSDMKIDIPVPKAAVTQIKRNLALDMAINALNCSEIPNNSDVISRQAALETIRTMQTYKLFSGDDMILIDKAEAQTELMMLPSVQPDIIRCKDCKWYGRADKRRFYRGMDCLQKRIDTIVPGRDFCSRAERKTKNADVNT